jgi:murein DD-endopeptidase MepM/ murein hydrolase activator NlpD
MTRLCSVIAVLAVIAVTPCQADIYRLDGDDDVVSFTDSPQDRRFQLIQKEQRRAGTSRFARRPATRTTDLKSEQEVGTSRGLPIQGRITSTTGMRSDPFDGKLKHHNGLDIAAPTGTPVKPVAPGTVIFSGWKKGYGNTVILEHRDGMVTVYAHHASNNVAVGEPVDQGTVIALSGSTGRSTGPHLHFEAWRDGSNITQEFMPGAAAEQQSGTVASAPINRYLQADGTIVFTNMR